MAALLLKEPNPERPPGGLLFSWFFKGFNWLFGHTTRGYTHLTRQLLRFAVIPLVLFAALGLWTVRLFQETPTNFVPDQDKGYLVTIVQLPDGASLDRTEAVAREVSEIIMDHPAVREWTGLTFQ